jgi:hypothetical protein
VERVNDAKLADFERELRILVKRYLDMPDVDALGMVGPLSRIADDVRFIACHDRRRTDIARYGAG